MSDLSQVDGDIKSRIIWGESKESVLSEYESHPRYTEIVEFVDYLIERRRQYIQFKGMQFLRNSAIALVVSGALFCWLYVNGPPQSIRGTSARDGEVFLIPALIGIYGIKRLSDGLFCVIWPEHHKRSLSEEEFEVHDP